MQVHLLADVVRTVVYLRDINDAERSQKRISKPSTRSVQPVPLFRVTSMLRPWQRRWKSKPTAKVSTG